MARYVPDIKTQRWVIMSPGRIARPTQDDKTPPLCPFCNGNESQTPPEIYRIGNGEANKPGWLVRVVPNKFPITDLHEVIIHSPDNEKDIPDLPLAHVAKILSVYRDRYRAHDSDGQVLIFCNHGLAAGASLGHPHSQLVVLPRQINLDALTREPVANIIHDNKYFVTYCPDFSQWPFEVWIAPKNSSGKFGEIVDAELSDLAQILQSALVRIRKMQIHDTDAFVYNYYIYHGDNWYLRIIPRFIHRAGFELGTGLNVNIIDPTEAAKLLKNV